MTLQDLKDKMAVLDRKLNTINEQRDILAAEAKTIAAQRAEIHEGLMLLEKTSERSPMRTHILQAMGIKSEEHVNGQ